MRESRLHLLVPLAALLATATGACGDTRAPALRAPTAVPADHPPASALAAAPVDASCDGASLAARNMGAMGPAFTHPVTLSARVRGAMGETSLSWSYDARRLVTREDPAGGATGDGVDDEGGWTVDATGVFLRTRAGEIDGRDALVWIFRRGHLDMLRSGALALECTDGAAGPRAVARSSDVALGAPALTFDRRTGALLSMDASTPLGRRQRTTFTAWSEPDATGARYPQAWTTAWTASADADDAGGELHMTTTSFAATPPCASATRPSAGCVGAPAPTFRLDLPPGGARVPFRFAMRELTLHAEVDRRKVAAFLDSGAELSGLDMSMPLGKAFVPAATMGVVTASDDSTEAGVGVLPLVRVGAAQAHDLPTLAVTAPIFAAFGALRPEIVLGMSFFESSVLRIDFARQEIVMTPPGKAPHAADAVAVPLRIIDGRFVASVEIDGQHADTIVDSGSMGLLDVDEAWARRAHLADDHPTIHYASNDAVGNVASEHAVMRGDRLVFGPVALDRPAIGIDTRSFTSSVPGVLGNGVLSSCRAAVFDAVGRTLWLEPPCREPPPERGLGWRLVSLPAPARHATSATTWKVDLLLPGGSAEKGGILVGDEILRVEGVRLGADPSVLEGILQRAAGSTVRVILRRGDELHTVDVPLVEALPR